MLVDLDVLIAHADEARVAEAVRVSVALAAQAPTYGLGASTWRDGLDGEDLVRQWSVEHSDVPLGGRRVRRLTMSVEGDGVADLVEEVSWAAVEAVWPRRPGRRSGGSRRAR